MRCSGLCLPVCVCVCVSCTNHTSHHSTAHHITTTAQHSTAQHITSHHVTSRYITSRTHTAARQIQSLEERVRSKEVIERNALLTGAVLRSPPTNTQHSTTHNTTQHVSSHLRHVLPPTHPPNTTATRPRAVRAPLTSTEMRGPMSASSTQLPFDPLCSYTDACVTTSHVSR
jgi:hypothetical protein